MPIVSQVGRVVRWFCAAVAAHGRSKANAISCRVRRALGQGAPFELRSLLARPAADWFTIERVLWRAHEQLRPEPPRPITGGRLARHFHRHRAAPVFDRYVARLRGARVFSQDQFVFLPDGSLFVEHHYHNQRWLAEHRTLLKPLPGVRKVAGPAFSLAPAYPHYHYHWMAEVPTRLFGTLELLPPATEFIIPKDTPPLHRDALAAFGIGHERLREIDHDDMLEAEELWYAPPIAPTGWHLPAVVAWTRACFWRHFLKKVSSEQDRGTRKLFISRGKAALRRVANEDELAAAAEQRGFQKIVCEDLPLAEQVRQFAEARAIVAPHGAGLVNLLFAPPGGRLLEIFPRSFPTIGFCFWSLARAASWDYTYLHGTTRYEARSRHEVEADFDEVCRWMDAVDV